MKAILRYWSKLATKYDHFCYNEFCFMDTSLLVGLLNNAGILLD